MRIPSAAVLCWILLLGCLAGADEVDCESPRTRDIERCGELELQKREAELERYLTAVRRSAPDNVREQLDRSQADWLSYRESHCRAVYEHWIEGTIRGAMYIGCKLGLTSARTRQLWQDFMDKDEPALPEPSG